MVTDCLVCSTCFLDSSRVALSCLGELKKEEEGEEMVVLLCCSIFD